MKYFNWQKNINQKELLEVKNILESGGIVIFPTETVYGIAANALSKKAIEKLFLAKKRPKEKAINIMVKSPSEIKKYAYIKNIKEQKIIDNFMPGPLTIILNKKDNFGRGFTLPDTIGIRIPNNEIALAILNEITVPLIASSANISGTTTSNDITQIIETFKGSVDIIIEGSINNNYPSTIVKAFNDIEILRQGPITKEDIEVIL